MTECVVSRLITPADASTSFYRIVPDHQIVGA
jgi:hypothetical protein